MKKISKRISLEKIDVRKMKKEELDKLKGGKSSKGHEDIVDGGTLDEVTVQSVASAR